MNENDTSNELELYDGLKNNDCNIPDEEMEEVKITRSHAFVGKTFWLQI